MDDYLVAENPPKYSRIICLSGGAYVLDKFAVVLAPAPSTWLPRRSQIQTSCGHGRGVCRAPFYHPFSPSFC